MDYELGQLKRVNPRTVWKSESREFTPWLAKTIEKLGDTLGKELELVGTVIVNYPIAPFLRIRNRLLHVTGSVIQCFP